MKKLFLNALIIIIYFVALNVSYAQWTNGQSAVNVLGTAGSYTAVGSLTASGVAIDEINNKIYIADYCNSAVYRYALTDGNLPSAAVKEATFGVTGTSGTSQSLLKNPSGLVVDNTGRLFIADGGNNRVIYIDNAYSRSNNPIFDGLLGQINYTIGTVNRGAGVSANNSFNFTVSSPSSLFSCQSASNASYLAISADNILFVSDPGNNRVMRFNNPVSSKIADAVIGQLTYAASIFGTTSSNLKTPMGIALRGSTLYIADMNNSRILRFDNALTIKTGTNTANAVYGQSNFTSSSGGRSATTFDLPIGIAVDVNNRLYINDSNNGRTVSIDNANTKNGGTGTAVTFNGVLGQANMTAYAGTASSTAIWAGVTGLAVSSNTKLFIGNSGFGRLLQYNSSSPLPVNFVNFILKEQNGNLNFRWTTSLEYNNKTFEIEGSNDGVEFYKIATVGSKGNSNTLTSYSIMLHKTVYNSYSSYRVKQIDVDAHFSFSKVISVDENINTFSVYPNPVVDNVLHYTLENVSGDAQIEIISIEGKIELTSTPNEQSGILNLSDLKPGIYVVRIISSQNIFMEKIIKK